MNIFEIEKTTENPRAHFIGLCGKGMSAVAYLLKERGWEISGSDQGVYDPIKTYLESTEMMCKVPHDPANIPDVVELVVIGRHAKLVPATNAEVARAFADFSDRILSFPDALQQLTSQTNNIVVAGSYGKSTTTSMLAHIMREAQLDPSFFIGAKPYGFDTTSHSGSGEFFILEGDEYPASNTDNTSKFMYYNVHDVILTSGEHDHVNVFPTLADYHAPYIQLMENLPESGLVVACADDVHAGELGAHSGARITTYGLRSGTYQARNIQYGMVTKFDLYKDEELLGGLSTQLLGTHNVQNCTGVAAMILEKNLMDFDQLASGMHSFLGLKRRLDRVNSPDSNIPMYEGYGSSYTKVRTAVDAIGLHFPSKKLRILFEPHSFSLRNRMNLPWYETAFEGAESVGIYPPPGHGASTHAQLSHEEIIAHTQQFITNVVGVVNLDQISDFVKGADTETVVLVLTSGSFDGMMNDIKKLV